MKEENFDKIKNIKDIKEIFINLFPIFYERKNSINILSFCFYRINKKYDYKNNNSYIKLNDDKFPLKLIFKNGIVRLKFKDYIYFFNIYKGSINKNNLKNYPPQNLVKVMFENNQENVVMPVIYNIIHLKRYKGLNSKIYNLGENNLVTYFRQAKLNSMAVTVREKNITDSKSKQLLIKLAKILSLITPPKNIILLYEKEANKYEESASVVYEKLIDLKYDNAYFIINKNSKHIDFIKNKYKTNIVYAHTFKHYFYFFKCHKFIGSESVPHSIELRAANKYIARKLSRKKYKFVFLQHGVMYMIALDSVSRTGFRKNGNEMPHDAKIVVSSKLEANHFIELGGFEKKDLYITGLPFYDRTVKKETADKIVIMPTWRNWDYNLLLTDYKKASYYKFCKNLIDNIPKEFKEKLYLLPHPLILNKFRNTDLKKWIPDIISYDKILEETALLITDYSSISYSAFYRGANVIFCWEELDECMKHYKSHLMLNANNTFGDIIYKNNELKQIVKDNYLKKQKPKYISNYKKIVEFHDNKNTDRLIKCLKKDNFI